MAKLGKLGFSESHNRILDSIMEGGPNWKTFDGTCLENCPHYDLCPEGGEGPANVCSTQWRAAKGTPEVLGVVLHVVSNFEYYNRKDLPLPDDGVLADIVAMMRDGLSDFSDDFEFSEGAMIDGSHRRRERNNGVGWQKKSKAYNSGQLICEACGVDYKMLYGRASLRVIECHHEIPLCSADHTGKTRLGDLHLLCANCHRLAHAESPPASIEALRSRVASKKNATGDGRGD